ncbi:MAG: DJ-1/PfpI family protein [Bradyrhizobiaceae bacterium]|nr:DJ-1/PfpI family protein [Bradyrhizobiaceae bacterium]
MHCLVPIANGSEEMEAVIVIDMLRRAGVDVTVAGDGDMVTCSRGIRIVPDIAIDDIADDDEFDIIVLPGGSQGVQNFIENDALRQILARHRTRRKPLGAICAAPLVLHEYGLLRGDAKITSHPSCETELSPYNYSTDRVVEDMGIITSRGAGTAFEFALELIRRFVDEATARRVSTDIVLYE